MSAQAKTPAQQIAETILAQLGANRFLAMTGARDLVALRDGLQIKLPANFARAGVNLVRIQLAADDTYTISAGRFRALDYKEKAHEEGIYSDQLRAAFTRLTGLDTHL